MLTVDRIEAKYSFQYPALYRQLAADNMLNMGEKGSLWYQNEYPKYRQKPPLLMFAAEFEPCDLDEVDERIAALRDPIRNTNPNFVLIPFGTSGAGDDYCFYLSGKTGEDVPIVMVWHDDDKADYHAKNLQDFIFKKLLETALEININDTDLLVDERNMLASHKPYLTVSKWRILAEVYARTPRDYADQTSLLSQEEFNQIIAKETAFSEQNKRFIYTLPEPIIEITETNKRRVGCLKLTVNQAIDANFAQHLKALNWRQDKSASSNVTCYLRNNYVIFGLPCMANLDDTFKDKLQFLKDHFDIALTFTEFETGIATEL